MGETHFGYPREPAVATQDAEMTSRSRFLWDLNTWDQGTVDLRQVDAFVGLDQGNIVIRPGVHTAAPFCAHFASGGPF